jgi:aspartate/methionine/tyrosine aminotransferase
MKPTPIQMKYDQWQQFNQIVDDAISQIVADLQIDKYDYNLKLMLMNLVKVKERIDMALAKVGRNKFTINLDPAQALALYLTYRLLYLQTDDKYIDTLIKSKIVFILDKSVG